MYMCFSFLSYLYIQMWIAAHNSQTEVRSLWVGIHIVKRPPSCEHTIVFSSAAANCTITLQYSSYSCVLLSLAPA